MQMLWDRAYNELTAACGGNLDVTVECAKQLLKVARIARVMAKRPTLYARAVERLHTIMEAEMAAHGGVNLTVRFIESTRRRSDA